MRNHGVHSTFDTSFSQFGFNFKYNDVLASIGLVQIEKLQKKKEVHNKIYDFYRKELKGIGYLRFMDIDQKRGEIPLWVETLCSNREKVIEKLKSRNIQTRPFLPDLHHSPHLNCTKSVFTNSELFEREGLYLPSGADQTQFALERTVEALHEIKGEV